MTRWAWLGLVAVGAVAIASVLVPFGRRGDSRPLAPAVAPTALPAADAAYYEAVAPRLDRAALDADALVDIGERRSRNLIEIRAAQERMDESLAVLDLLLANRPPPDRFAPSVAAYREGAAAVREAMAEARAGFLRLDWDRVAAAYDRAADGAAALHRAERGLGSAAGRTAPATPVAPVERDLVRGRGGAHRASKLATDVL